MLSLSGSRVRQAEKIEASPRRGFRSESIRPLTSRISGGLTGWKRWAAAATLGAAMLFGAACSKHEATRESENITFQQGESNAEGKFTFEVGEKRFELTVKNIETMTPVQGAVAEFVTDSNEGGFFVFDPEQKLHSRIIGAASGLGQELSTVRRAVTPSQTFSYTDFLIPVGPIIITECDITNCFPPPRRVVTQNMVPPWLFYNDFAYNHLFGHQSTVPLSDLDYTLLDLAREIGEGVVSGEVIQKMGIKLSARVQAAMLVSQIITDGEQALWADYYRSLCYKDTDQFEIRKFLFPDIQFVANNPAFIVLPEQPKEGENAWIAPTGKISGMVYLSDGALATENSVLIRLYPVGQTSLPPIEVANKKSGDFSIIASACPDHNQYMMSAYSPTTGEYSECQGPFTITNGTILSHDVSLTSGPQFTTPGQRINLECTNQPSTGVGDGGTSTVCSGESVFYRDCDGDGLGDARVAAVLCNDEHSGYVANSEDCDDGHANVGRRLVSRVTCGEYRTSRRLDACERGAWSFGDCLPLTDGELDGGVGRADGGPARDGGTAQVDGGASVSQCSTSWSWPSNCRVLYVSDVVHPASDGVDFRGRWVAVQEERIVFINLDTLEVGVVPELPGWFQDYPRIWGDSIYFQRHSTWNYATSLLTRYDILTGAFTEFTYRFNHEGFEWDAPWLGEGPVYGSNVVMCDLPLPETSACSVFNTANESLTALKWFNDPIPESGRSMSLASIYGDTVVAFEETSSSDLCGYSVDGSASWRIKANLQSELIGVGAGFVAYSDSTGLHTVGLQGGEPVLVSPAGYQTYIQSVSDSRIAYTAVDASGNRHGFIYDVRTGTTQDVGLKGNYPKISERGVVSTMIEFVNGGSRTQSYILLCEE